MHPEVSPRERASASRAGAGAGAEDVVLIVDDVPENLEALHDALDESGYVVLVATSGEAALERCRDAQPDIVLLDAMVPGLDGFGVASRLQAASETAHIPIILMTGLTDTEHVVRAFEAGGVDYITKPIRPAEVLARIGVHVRHARHGAQARNALDAFGQAAFAVRLADARVVWQTPLARKLCAQYLGTTAGPVLPEPLAHWALAQANALRRGLPATDHTLAQGTRRLTLTLHGDTGDGDWLVVVRETSDICAERAMATAFSLTAREAQVLHWVVQGKTNRDIADILGMSPRTVNKHLEHVFEKLGVETRTAAASVAMQRAARPSPA